MTSGTPRSITPRGTTTPASLRPQGVGSGGDRIPWEIVETLPGTDATTVARWEKTARDSTEPDERVRALVGYALSTYWLVQTGLSDEPWAVVAARRAEAVDEALDFARQFGDADLLAEALLGQLHARWGPDHLLARGPVLEELEPLHDEVGNEETRYQIRSWSVLTAFDAGDLRRAEEGIEQVADESRGTALVLYPRRVRLWRANLAMLRGDIDASVAMNQEVLADTAPTAGSPFSFQDAMVTFAIERYFRRGLADVIDPVRSVRASSPRVGANWQAALAFSLAEAGQLDEAASVFGALAAEGFVAIVRDLNWLASTVLLGLTALDLDAVDHVETIAGMLGPFAAVDATHGSGYASYGPVGRVVGMLDARLGRLDDARSTLATVIAGRDAGPWTSLTKLALARVGIDGHEEAATLTGRGGRNRGGRGETELLAEQAAAELQALGLDAWAVEARDVERGARDARHSRDSVPTADRHGSAWRLLHPSGEASVGHSRGVELLVELLERPGEVIDVAELEGTDRALPHSGVAEPVIDQTARRAYVARLAELESMAARGRAEDDEITALRRAVAGGAYAPSRSAEHERARVRVTKALRRAIAAVAESSPGLGAHLAESVSTGRTCLYAPRDGRSWVVHRGRSS